MSGHETVEPKTKQDDPLIKQIEQYTADLKSLGAVKEPRNTVAITTPWHVASQVVAVTCMNLEELKDHPDATEYEKELARTAAGTIHAVCLILDRLEEHWFDRENEAAGH